MSAINMKLTFTILDHERFEEIVEALTKVADTEEGCVFYQWACAGDNAVCSQIFKTPESAIAHQRLVEDLASELVSTVTNAGSWQIFATEEDIENIKPLLEEEGIPVFLIDFFETKSEVSIF